MAFENKNNQTKHTSQKFIWTVILLGLSAGFSILLAFISTGFLTYEGWISFFWVFLLSGAIVLGVWLLLRQENPPNWLLYLVLGAALLRLGVGAFWSISLPVWGHGTPAEQGGYVMGDAAGRDQAAWRLAGSGESLLTAFRDNRRVDQYGGLLFVSALTYRYLGSYYHQPLLIVLLGAACSALAVLFCWAFVRRVWGNAAAAVAAWGIFLYPEAVLLGSSQMREAFTIPLAAAAFYGLARYQEDRKITDLAWILIPFFLTLFFSTLSATMLLGCLVLAALVMVRIGSKDAIHQRWFWPILALLVVVGLIGLWLALREVTPDRITNPIAMASWWLQKSASFQAYISEHASGWMQKIFKFTPEWTHLPMLVAYGVVQPFLPASLIAGSDSPVWRGIAVWRSVGWTLLLAFLAFAPFHAFRKNGNQSLTRMLTVIVWLIILVAAFRGGSDMWDNPRYRAIFSVLQIALAARIWVEESQARDPWLRRALLVAGAILVWFLPWYLQRYYSIGWPVTDPFRILGMGFCTGVLLLIADWAGNPGVKTSLAPTTAQKQIDTSPQ
jgi:hypothetical protein